MVWLLMLLARRRHGHERAGEALRVLLVAGGGSAGHGFLEEGGGAAGHDALVGHGLEDFDGHGDEAEEGGDFDFGGFLIDVDEDDGGGEDGVGCVVEPVVVEVLVSTELEQARGKIVRSTVGA